MSVSIKAEDVIIVDPKTELISDFDEDSSNEDIPTEFIEFPDTIEVNGTISNEHSSSKLSVIGTTNDRVDPYCLHLTILSSPVNKGWGAGKFF